MKCEEFVLSKTEAVWELSFLYKPFLKPFGKNGSQIGYSRRGMYRLLPEILMIFCTPTSDDTRSTLINI